MIMFGKIHDHVLPIMSYKSKMVFEREHWEMVAFMQWVEKFEIVNILIFELIQQVF